MIFCGLHYFFSLFFSFVLYSLHMSFSIFSFTCDIHNILLFVLIRLLKEARTLLKKTWSTSIWYVWDTDMLGHVSDTWKYVSNINFFVLCSDTLGTLVGVIMQFLKIPLGSKYCVWFYKNNIGYKSLKYACICVSTHTHTHTHTYIIQRILDEPVS